MDFGPHTPFIAAAYSASILAIAALIAMRVHRFREANRAEKSNTDMRNN